MRMSLCSQSSDYLPVKSQALAARTAGIPIITRSLRRASRVLLSCILVKSRQLQDLSRTNVVAYRRRNMDAKARTMLGQSRLLSPMVELD